MNPTPTVKSAPRLLYMAIGATVLSFIPVLCLGGIWLGIATLQKALKTKDTLTQVLSIIAIVIGSLTTLQTIFGCFILFQNMDGPPDFEGGR